MSGCPKCECFRITSVYGLLIFSFVLSLRIMIIPYFLFSESVSDLITGDYMGAKTTLVYAVFTTPDNSIGGNAICAFKLEVYEIDDR